MVSRATALRSDNCHRPSLQASASDAAAPPSVPASASVAADPPSVPASASDAAAPPSVPASASVPPPTEEHEVPGAAALRSIDEALAQRICSSKLADLRSLEPDRTSSLGTWMIWMVQRAAANDPSLTSLNFRQLMMPAPEDEPRIA